ncbi:MAG: hypothetical protein M3R12_11515 [Actinomycetota bacterium]|nr:hypothetical protein [Actinomycetota bacterium]
MSDVSRFRWFLLLVALSTALLAASPSSAVDIPPAPPSVGTAVPLSYFGPTPSQVDKRLVGPVQLLRSGELDLKKNTIELPLYLGHLEDGRNVWFILTDTTDERNAEALGLNHSAKLHYSDVGNAVRSGRLTKQAGLVFDNGAVDFSPARVLRPGKGRNAFPPSVARPGSVGDGDYSPLVKIQNAGGHIYNAPVVAFDVTAAQIRACKTRPNYRLVHDRVARICPGGNGGGTVTIKLTPIFSFARPSLYMSTEASDPMVATLDAGTHTPAMADIPVGRDDSVFSAVERLFVIANGPTGKNNPQRQGLNSALADGRPPLNIIGGIPTLALDYSPMWDLNLGFWTPNAVRRGYRSRLIDEFQLLGFVRDGHITGMGGKRFGSTGIVVNCPIVHRFL